MHALKGVELATIDMGVGDAVILIHGFPELAYSWRHQVPALATAGFRAIAYDQRGYGGSSKPETVESYGLATLAADAIGLLDLLDIERATFVGHDWGSIVAWTAAVLHPDRVDKVVSLNVPYRGWCAGFPSTDIIRDHLADRFGYVLGFQEVGTTEAAFESDPNAWLRAIYTGIAADPTFMTDDEFAAYRGRVHAWRPVRTAGAVSQHRRQRRRHQASRQRSDHPADADAHGRPGSDPASEACRRDEPVGRQPHGRADHGERTLDPTGAARAGQ